MEWGDITVNDVDIEFELKEVSPQWLMGIGAIVIGTLVLLTWLYLRAEAVSPQLDNSYTQQLKDFREADARVDGEVLATRIELARNYDALTAYLKAEIAASRSISNPPEFLLADDMLTVKEQSKILAETLQEKIHQIDLFKRNNAILRNSLAYFQKTANEMLGANRASVATNLLERYVRHVMFYVRTPDLEHRKQLEMSQKKLTQAVVDSIERDAIDNLLLHGSVIEKYVPRVDRLIRNTLRLGATAQHSDVRLAYLDGVENARRISQQFRNLLYMVALLLTTYLAYTFMRLGLTRRSLAKAHREVTQRYQAQKRAEKQLILHDTAFDSAHEGITLTDADGMILDVNPAFVRITGYEREEVIGHNPRVLKSGRHDEEFYRVMWKSIIDTGNWRGEIWNKNKFGEIYPEMLSVTTVRNSKDEVTNYVAVFSDIRRIKEQEKQLQQMAYYDALTDLPNRVLLTDRMVQSMSQTLRTETVMAVCYLDLDGFKPINDTYGHDAGDRLLVELANRFKHDLRGGDTVARLGGDEFVFLLLGLEHHDEYQLAVQRLTTSISQQFSINGEPVTVSASIGIALYPQDDCDADTLLRHADQAMYLAKQKGKDCYHLFDPEQDSLARSQHEQISRIETALRNDELVLYYQPKVNMRQGEVVGVEALIRWEHPDRGLIPPMDFLPAIEDHELIVTIGKWVIEKALSQIELWKSAGLDISVSVNVASRQLQAPDFVTTLKELLAKHPKVTAENLELEVLETAALEDIVSVSKIIEECRELGIYFALDDFGTGYSSLTYLKRLPAETLKIDQSFIRDMMKDPENLAIVQGILGLATAFQRKAIAEGVETIEHGRMLLQLGCDYAQGYGIAKPMPADDILNWAKQWQPAAEWASISGLYWDDADYPMLAAEVEHKRWIALLIHAMESGQPISHKQVGNYHHCRFGEWYYDRANYRYSDIPSYQKIEEPHKQIHAIAEKMDQHHRDGNTERAKALIPGLLAQHQVVLSELMDLSLEIAFSHQSHPEQINKL